MAATCVPLVIPAYEPDERLLFLLQGVKESGIHPVILVDDGSGEAYQKIFDRAKNLMESEEFVFLAYEENKGKGHALRTAFSYVFLNYKEAIGVVTADSDGQHTCSSIQNVREQLILHPDALVLGCRNFEQEEIPWKNRIGNRLTKKVLTYVSSIRLGDTQTGLRGIPFTFMEELIDLDSERFEFEMQMLLEALGKRELIEVPIPTIYDLEKSNQTHFRPVTDSAMIYQILCFQFYKYLFASLSSSIIDLSLFQVSCMLLKNKIIWYLMAATGIARIASASYNYTMNHEFVFRSRKRKKKTLPRYVALAMIQMFLSAFFLTGLTFFFLEIPEIVVKMIVDTGLFFVNYKIQQKYIF